MIFSQMWTGRLMGLAREIAGWSKDPSTKVGCIIVDVERRVLSTGYNGFPRGVLDSPVRYDDKAIKYALVVHAEANAIAAAARLGHGIANAILFSTKFPCSDCCKLIIQAGISAVISPPPNSEGKWYDDAQYATLLLSEGLVEHHTYD